MARSADRLLRDQAERDRIAGDLDTTMLVEAAAGTGKTTSMVGRMVRLLAEGRCKVPTMAAVTFTRKATAELRDRFRRELEHALRDADGARRERLEDALNHVEQCFIGTIHSFCARLLRERPIEAEIDVAFDELDEDEEYRLRFAAWDEHVAALHAAHAPILGTLDELGLEPADLRPAYMEFAEYPDVEAWPVPDGDFDHELANDARGVLKAYATLATADDLPRSAGNDTLIPFCRDLPRRLRHARLHEDRALMDILEEVAGLKVVQKEWPGGRTRGVAERDRLEAFQQGTVEPLLAQWRRRRYGPVLELLRGAAGRYDALRMERGVLSYQDLLMKAAALLRDKPAIRRYFRGRFTHLLVDEFQDTDPIQAEVMMLLTAADHDETGWQACRPVAGSLFVVGDPKQAIYRFRRADIVTYNEVRGIIESCGVVVGLTTNFRSDPPLIDWFNTVSATLFPKHFTRHSPPDRPMHPRVDAAGDPPVSALDAPGGLKRYQVNRFEADAIARVIRDRVDRGTHAPGDFLILSWVRGPLVEYARALEAYGLPVEVTGGTAVNELDEVALLHTVLAAVVEPDNPVALVAALRSELFGVSDTTLYRFRKSGGVFNFYVDGDHDGGAGMAAIDDARGRLKGYAGWLSRLPPVAAIERIAADLGLFARAARGADGRARAGGLCKAIELLRAASREYWTAADLLRYLWNLVNPDPDIRERHDGASLIPHVQPAVRVMNLHQAKGLEAPVVFLADGSGQPRREVDLHVERSGGVVTGSIQFRKKKKGDYGRGRVLAVPEGWEDREQEELQFRDAERDRLLYVAATRAASELVVSRPTKRRRWEKLLAHVPDGNAIDELPVVTAPVVATRTLPADAPQQFAESVVDRWAARRAPTYDVTQLKSLAVKGSMKAAHPGEHGTEWGTVLHLLLEAAMNDPAADLETLAEAALREHDLDPAEAPAALLLVRSVMRSDLWKRATACPRRMTEVPVQFMANDAAVPTLVRGVIDLVFEGPEGWVIVDYKTDDREGESVEPLVVHYAPQVQRYAEAWARITGAEVAEAGLYFVRTDRYRALNPAPTEA